MRLIRILREKVQSPESQTVRREVLGSVKREEAIKETEASLEKDGENKHQDRVLLWNQTGEEQFQETVAYRLCSL